MAIYRGPGGAGDATNDATSQAILAAESVQQAAASAAAASASASQAATSATNASSSASAATSSASSASSSANSASTSASNAETYKLAAEAAQSAAETAETNAETAATNAASSASSASTSATAVASSASAASTSATNAATSATNAANSATAAATSETNAASSASAASTSATNAASSATAAAISASSASTSATSAAASATAADISEANAATSETNAATSASAAATSATNAATSETNAATSATNAASSATAAAGSATSAAGSASAAASSASDAADSATEAAGYAASINPANFATAAQGAKADTALQPASIGVSVQGYDADLAAVAASNAGSQIASYGQYGVGFKNRIINGDMRIDQRNAGASVTNGTSDSFPVDRMRMIGSQASKFTAQRSATAPAGFTNSLLITSSSAYSVGSSERFIVGQYIEGLNVADLGWGTANAQPVTLSFQVRSSLTGTFGGAVRNSAGDRSYPFSYTISAANTWTSIAVTIVGDTTGTWLTDTSVGLNISFNIGSGSTLLTTAGSWNSGSYFGPTGATSVVGTNGATFYITGVQLEKGSVATPFEVRPYGTELALCQRYYFKTAPGAGILFSGSGTCFSTTTVRTSIPFFVPMRIAPTSLEQSGTASDYSVLNSGAWINCSSVPAFSAASTTTIGITFWVSSGLTSGGGAVVRAETTPGYLGWSAEL